MMQSSSLGPDQCPSGSSRRGQYHHLPSYRVSTIVRGSTAATSNLTDVEMMRTAFVKPLPVTPISAQNPRIMSRNNNLEASPMSISSSPSPSSTDPQYRRLGYNANSHNRPILLENGAKAYVTKDSIEVVSNVPVVKADTSRVDNFKTPMTVHSPSSTIDIGRRRGGTANQHDVVGVVDIGQGDVEVIEEKIISSSTVSSTTSSPSSKPLAKRGRGRPRKQVAKRSPPKAVKGTGGRREEPKSSSSGLSNLAVVPSLTLIDKSHCPPRIFDRGELLGTGGFAKVYKVTERSSGDKYADKVINKEIFARRANARNKVEREIHLHRKMNHANIVKFYEFFEDTNFVHMVLELAPQGSLLNVSKNRGNLTEPEVRYYFRQIAAGTRYIHSQRILHRDLKLGNMFLSEHMEIKIGDFGLSTSFTENKPSLCGTPNYVSPEIIAKKGHSISSEVWSIGCIIYALLCGKPPFDSGSVERTYHLITNCEFSLPEHLSSTAVEFLLNILIVDPERRGTLEEPTRTRNSRSLLAHPFIQNSFTPTYLPPSAVNFPPDFSDYVIDLTNNNGNTEEDQEKPGCSPGISSTFRRMRGFFNTKNDFLEQALVCIDQFMTRSYAIGVSSQPLKQIPVYVSKWVDYTNRFGFVYKLSDGSIGVLFNDNTKLGVKNGGKIVEFTDMKGKYYSFATDENANNQNSHVWPEIYSRIEKLQAYIKYMEDFLNDTVVDDEVLEIISTGQKTVIPQMKRWHRTGSCIGMEFNSNLVQINFKEEHIKVLIWMYENEMFLTSICENKSQTFSLNSQTTKYLNPRVGDILLEVASKLRELLSIQIKD